MTRASVCIADLCDLIAEPVRPGVRPDSLYLGLEHLASGRLVRIGGGQASEMRSNTSAFLPGDVLYGKLRPYLDKAVLVDESGVCTTELLVLRPKAGVDPRFLVSILHSPDFIGHAVAGTTGVQHPRTSWAHISGFDVPTSILGQQRQVADLLWLIHEAINRSEAVAYEAQALKRAAMRTLFTRGLRGEAQKETEIGSMPESWGVVDFSSLRHRLQYGTSTRCTPEPARYPVLRIPNVAPQRINTSNLKYCDLPDSDAARYLLDDGDILFVRTNGVLDRLGTCAIYSGQPPNALFASYLIRASLQAGRVLPRFAAYFLNSECGMSMIESRAIAASDGKFNLNSAAIDSMLLPLPVTLDEQLEIVEILDGIDHKIDLHHRKRAAMDELFEALLHQLMTGKIQVRELQMLEIKEG